ncbi:hypothetical protein K435DRAFT_697337 [Dendrothele bispora CBS 962.96]|uniref:Uncharacterized protein n=1 Tax=Dendrothele bispora (strain CBS 962.96) TaxID=1314807 RepID=A0A4S8KUU4_DENBC|nr:hypothetical protein K435DRAFT_697337 [Dendrothele bispora CBS 962.96]
MYISCEDLFAEKGFTTAIDDGIVLFFGLPSLATNLIATSMIGYKAWYVWFINSAGQVQKILAFLIESGTFYCLCWASHSFFQCVQY